MRCSVLLAVYNDVPIVRATLHGLAGQSEPDFEVVICDDGSTSESRLAIRAECETLRLRCQYAYHSVEGFQKTIVLNKGVALARSEYVVILDGDCVPHRHFVRYHCRLRRRGTYLCGRRVLLGPSASDALTRDPSRARAVSALRVLCKGRHVEEGLILPAGIRRLIGVHDLVGCNWSCWKSDLEAINGFDNRAMGPVGGEDTNIYLRFGMRGVRKESARFGANVFHQYHPKRARSPTHESRLVHPDRVCEMVCSDGLREVSRFT